MKIPQTPPFLRVIMCAALALAATLGPVRADPALPMQSQPLSTAFLNEPGDDLPAIGQIAQVQSYSQPRYKSNAVENVTFTGYFQAADATAQLALLSDDGADLYINGVKVHSGYQKAQGLADLRVSFSPISYTFDPAQVYSIKIVYSNVLLTGPADIDGVTLFCYGGGGSIVTGFSVSVTSGLTGNAARACAGAVADSVHEDALTLHVAQADGTAAAGLPLTLAYDKSIDYTNCQAPQFIDDQNQNKAVPTLTRTTDGSGNVTLTVLSSDLISKPNVLVGNNGTQIGSVGCDFGAAQSIRRFGITSHDPSDGYGTDCGWSFNFDDLINPGDVVQAAFYLKFQKDPATVPIDKNYYSYNGVSLASMDVNGDGLVDDGEFQNVIVRGTTQYPLTDATNWLPVNGHTMHFRITQVTDFTIPAVITDPGLIQNYVFFCDANGAPISGSNSPLISAQTATNGSAVMSLGAGPMINDCSNVVLDAVDETQIGGDGDF